VRLSVVIPTRNRRELLGRVLRGLLEEQTAPPRDYEVVVVDDGSSDDTAQVVASSATRAAPLRYCHQESKGPAAARNLGLREAKGQIIVFTGDDCLPDPHLIEEHLRLHRREGDVGVLGHVAWHPDLPLTPLMTFLEEGVQFGFGLIKDPENVAHWSFYTANCSVQRHWIEEAGGFDEEFEYAAYEDIELAYRMQQQGLRIVYRPGALTYHYHPPTLEQHLARQRLCGRAAVLFWRKHPELKDQLGITSAAHRSAALALYHAASGYAYAIGVRDELRAEGLPDGSDLEALGKDPELARAGRAWVREVLGTDDPTVQELAALRLELRLMRQEWERVTSRRFYRWSEQLARIGWRLLSALGRGRRGGQG